MIQIAICEDLKQDYLNIEALIHAYMTEHHLKYNLDCFTTGEALLETFISTNYDLIILDLMLPGITGMETAIKIRERDKTCEIIFTTISEEYAIEGYRVHAADYLLKPVDAGHLAEALSRCRLFQNLEQPFISVEVNQSEKTLPVSKINYAEISGNYLLIHTKTGILYTYLSLKSLEAELPPDTFVRISRSHLVNMAAVLKIDESTILLSNSERLLVSRRRRPQVRASFNRYLLEKSRAE